MTIAVVTKGQNNVLLPLRCALSLVKQRLTFISLDLMRLVFFIQILLHIHVFFLFLFFFPLNVFKVLYLTLYLHTSIALIGCLCATHVTLVRGIYSMVALLWLVLFCGGAVLPACSGKIPIKFV